jgi:hypothetical protein
VKHINADKTETLIDHDEKSQILFRIDHRRADSFVRDADGRLHDCRRPVTRRATKPATPSKLSVMILALSKLLWMAR